MSHPDINYRDTDDSYDVFYSGFNCRPGTGEVQCLIVSVGTTQEPTVGMAQTFLVPIS